MKPFEDMAAMVKMIEQPWWSYDKDLQHMTGAKCRDIGKATKNLESRTTDPPKEVRDTNIADMRRLLNMLMIKRTARSTYMDDDKVLVVLPPHETRRVTCPLTDDQRTIIREADREIMRHAKAEYEKRCAEAVRLRREKPAPSAMSFFSKAHKLRAELSPSDLLLSLLKILTRPK